MTDDLDEVDEHELVLGPRPMSKNELDEFEAAESCRTLVLRSSGSRRASAAPFPAAGLGLVGEGPTAAVLAPDEVVGAREGNAEEGGNGWLGRVGSGGGECCNAGISGCRMRTTLCCC